MLATIVIGILITLFILFITLSIVAGIDKEYRRRQQKIEEDVKIWEEGKADYKSTTRTEVLNKIYQDNPKYLYLTLAITPNKCIYGFVVASFIAE